MMGRMFSELSLRDLVTVFLGTITIGTFYTNTFRELPSNLGQGRSIVFCW